MADFTANVIACLKVLACRNNVLLLGDELGDAGMADGVHNVDSILKIGFLYDRVRETEDVWLHDVMHVVKLSLFCVTFGCISLQVEERLEEFQKHFDIVLIDDQTMDVVNAILDLVL